MSGTGIFASFLFVIVVFAGWLTHIVVTIQAASWGLLIAGAIMAPVGIIHGWGIWFGIF